MLMFEEMYEQYVEVRECQAAMTEHEQVCVRDVHDECAFYQVIKAQRDQAKKVLRIHDEEVARIRNAQ